MAESKRVCKTGIEFHFVSPARSLCVPQMVLRLKRVSIEKERSCKRRVRETSESSRKRLTHQNVTCMRHGRTERCVCVCVSSTRRCIPDTHIEKATVAATLALSPVDFTVSLLRLPIPMQSQTHTHFRPVSRSRSFSCRDGETQRHVRTSLARDATLVTERLPK